LFSLDASFAIPTCVLRFEVSGSCCHPPVRPVLPIGQTSTHRSDRPSVVALWSSVLALWINQGTSGFVVKHWKPRGLGVTSRQSPLMTWPPRRPGSTLVLRLNQETIHDFVLLFLPTCDPHLIPLATGSLEPSLLVYSTPGGLTGIDPSRLFFTCTNTNQVAACTCNT
jgi:hypothetical protein